MAKYKHFWDPVIPSKTERVHPPTHMVWVLIKYDCVALFFYYKTFFEKWFMNMHTFRTEKHII